jgi:SAM-dependent methyltransferase
VDGNGSTDDGDAGLYDGFPAGFLRRTDERADGVFYEPARLVQHLDDRAIAAVGRLYAHLGIDGSSAEHRRVLDLMSSWVSHFLRPPAELVVLGMNAAELDANPAASERVCHDLNAAPTLPFGDGEFDAVICCVSIDYLVHPIEVLREVGRVLQPGGLVVITFSNRCFPTKAIHGWLATDDSGHVRIVSEYLRRAGCFDEPNAALCTPPATVGDPLYAVWASASARRRPPRRSKGGDP